MTDSGGQRPVQSSVFDSRPVGCTAWTNRPADLDDLLWYRTLRYPDS